MTLVRAQTVGHWGTIFTCVGLFSCSGDGASPHDAGDPTSGGAGSADLLSAGGTSSGGASAASGGQDATGGASGGAATSSGGAPSVGGAAPDTGGAGGSSLGACAELTPLPAGLAFDCGPDGVIFEDSGRPDNRVSYVIVGDGYTESQLDTIYLDHITNMLEHEDGMFGQLGEPYRRYRKFLNICALKVPSQDGCIDDLDTNLECDTAFDGYGDDLSRLGIVNENLVYAAIAERLPDSIDVDWVGVTINAGAQNWWNSGGAVMVWNGGYEPQGHSASVALHEGGHAFHGLADEYDGTSQSCSVAPELNVSTDASGEKWAEWLGFDHTPGSGLHGAFEGARYCATGVYRPTENSEMNLLPDYFNMPSIQKVIHDIYAVVDPIDAHTESDVPLSDPSALQVRVVDPEVIALSWSIDGAIVPGETGECFDLPDLEPGEHTIEVRAVDDTPWVRVGRGDLEQTVSWSVLIGQAD